MSDTFGWEATYEIARALRRAHPQVDLHDVSLGMILEWTLALEGFEDDPALANDEILAAIFQDWLEEELHGR